MMCQFLFEMVLAALAFLLGKKCGRQLLQNPSMAHFFRQSLFAVMFPQLCGITRNENRTCEKTTLPAIGFLLGRKAKMSYAFGNSFQQ